MRTLSKSKLLAYRQCPKRVWLEVHRPGLRADPASAQARFDAGHLVGDIARGLYGAGGKGTLLDPHRDGFEETFRRTDELLGKSAPIFEAAFRIPGALALADVMLPVRKSGKRMWKMVEVKSSTSVKDYHLDDAAIQAYVARTAGVPLAGVAIACIDSDWVYYHPSQQGSWSIKAVLPALCPELSYESLEGVQDGTMAMEAYLEAIASGTTPDRREQLRQQLLAYCELDTKGLLHLWSAFSGHPLEVH